MYTQLIYFIGGSLDHKTEVMMTPLGDCLSVPKVGTPYFVPKWNPHIYEETKNEIYYLREWRDNNVRYFLYVTEEFKTAGGFFQRVIDYYSGKDIAKFISKDGISFSEYEEFMQWRHKKLLKEVEVLK